VACRDGNGGKSVMDLYNKEHAHCEKEREERAKEEDRPPTVCAPPFLAGRGRES
jgi:hypothetical protein